MNRPPLAFAWIAFLAVLLATPARAGTTNLAWHWSNPAPFGNNVSDLAHHAGNPLVAVGDSGQVAITSDLATWTALDTGTRRWLRSAVWWGTNGTAAARLVVSASEGGILLSADARSYSLVDLGTTDWLEGVAASPTRLVAVGDNAAIYTSDNATNWVKRPVAFNDWLRGVAYRTGGPFVAVGENGLIASSPDGIVWTKRTSGVSTHLNRASPIRLAGNDGILVSGDGGVVLYSFDPQLRTWNAGRSDVTADLYVATQETRSDFASQFGALVVAGDEEVRSGTLLLGTLRFTDDTSTSRANPAPRASYFAGLSTGTNLVLAGRAGFVAVGARATSFSTVIDWFAPLQSPRGLLFGLATNVSWGTNISTRLVNDAIAYATNRTTNQFYVAVGDGPTLLQSDNGVGWITALVPTNAVGQAMLAVAPAPNTFVAVGSAGTLLRSTVAYSPLVTTNTYTNSASKVLVAVVTNLVNTLGIAWQSVPSPVANNLHGVAFGPSGFVACGDGGVLVASPDGAAWTKLASPTSQGLLSVEAGPSRWVATGNAGTLLTSTDGATWKAGTFPVATAVSRARWLGTQFVAVGEAGTVLTSPDGLAWTQRVSGVTNWLNDVVRVDGTYYAVGNQGTVLGSPDATAWSRLDSITYKSLYAAASLKGQLVAAGLDGAILRCQAGPYASGVELAKWPHSETESLFFFTGQTDQPFQLQRSTNLVDWTAGETLTITDAAGTYLFLDNTPNDAARQYFRTASPP